MRRRNYHRDRSGLWLPDGSRSPDRGIQVTVAPGGGSAPAHSYSLAAADGIVAGDAAGAPGSTYHPTAADGIVGADSVADVSALLVPNDTVDATFTADYTPLVNGSLVAPTGFSREAPPVAMHGALAMRRQCAQSGWAITNVAAGTPCRITAPGSGFTNGKRVGISATTTAADADYYGGAGGAGIRYAKNVAGQPDQFDLYSDAGLTTPVTAAAHGAGGIVDVGDIGPLAWRVWRIAGVDHLYDWVQWRFQTVFTQLPGQSQAWPTSPYKFSINEQGISGSQQFGALYVNADQLRWYLYPEFTGFAQQHVNLKPMTYIGDGAKHTIEVHHRRNGTAFPQVRIWIDDVLLTGPSSGGTPAPATWDAVTGVLDYGRRTETLGIGSINFMGTLNRGNLVPFDNWVDKISINIGDPGGLRIGL